MIAKTKNREKSMRARWGSQLANSKRGFTPVSNVLLDSYSALGISDSEFVFLVEVIRYKWTVDTPYPSLKTIAYKMEKNRSTVQRYARSLEQKGIIKRHYVEGAPSKLNLNPLIKLLEAIEPYPDINREGIQNVLKVCAKVDTKEESLRRKDNKGIKSIKEIIKEGKEV
jgi:DNA-binding MarR family transcriptional regulator